MEKKFTKFELARMKRTAQNLDQYVTKKHKLAAKLAELTKEFDTVVQLIDLTDAPTKAMTGGYGTEDIIKKVITPTDKLDKNGNPLKITSYEFIYPETIIPPKAKDECDEGYLLEELSQQEFMPMAGPIGYDLPSEIGPKNQNNNQ